MSIYLYQSPKHTKSPWTFDEHSFVGTKEEDSQTVGYFFTLSDHRSSKSRSPEETKANGRLIESAPDLLECLQLLILKIEDTSPDDFKDYCQDTSPDWEEIAKAKDIIKKAIGYG